MLRFRALVPIVAAAAVALTATFAAAQPAARGGDRDNAPRWWKPPSDVRRMLAEVDSRSLERYDRALVGFGTRHTLSSQDDPNRGIGAARDWIKRQFDAIAATSGGRMSVEL